MMAALSSAIRRQIPEFKERCLVLGGANEGKTNQATSRMSGDFMVVEGYFLETNCSTATLKNACIAN